MQPVLLGKRNGKRVSLTRYLEVRDRDSGELVGRLLNLSLGGLALISEKPIEEGRDFRLRIVVPAGGADSGPECIDVDVMSLWSEPDVNTDFYDTGFRLSRQDATLRQRIVRLTRQLGFER